MIYLQEQDRRGDYRPAWSQLTGEERQVFLKFTRRGRRGLMLYRQDYTDVVIALRLLHIGWLQRRDRPYRSYCIISDKGLAAYKAVKS